MAEGLTAEAAATSSPEQVPLRRADELLRRPGARLEGERVVLGAIALIADG
jgi:hypothetical protein